MFDIIYNPMSNNGKSLKTFNELKKEFDKLGIEYKVHATEYARHSIDIIKELNQTQNNTKAIVLGGDGTFGEAIQGVVNFDTISFGFVPCGTGNDFAKIMNFPKTVKELVAQFAKEETRFVDFIDVNDKRCLNVCGVGMDVDILERYAVQKGFKGKLKYYASFLWVVFHLKFHKIRYTLDGVTVDNDILITSIANGRYIGGGLDMSPNSNPFDGKLNVVMIDKLEKGRVSKMFAAFLKAKHLSKRETKEFLVEEFSLEILDDGKFQLDGEIHALKKITCKVQHEKLRILN